MGILPTAAGRVQTDSPLVGGQREETGHARTTAGSIDCRIRQRAQAWRGERLEQEIGDAEMFSTLARLRFAVNSTMLCCMNMPLDSSSILQTAFAFWNSK